MLRHMRLALEEHPALLLNRGTWLVVMKGLLGLKIDRYKRFKSSGRPAR
ncbi:MAG TPA: hypothetical protein VLH85_07330 [Levilinea sp.]|nr:hypothetical protein [Levilinea sp.]